MPDPFRGVVGYDAGFDESVDDGFEDGAGSFGPPQVITTSADGAVSVFAADLDGDGDPDVLSASFNDAKIAWYVRPKHLGRPPKPRRQERSDGAGTRHRGTSYGRRQE